MVVFFKTNNMFFFVEIVIVYMPYLLDIFECVILALGAHSIERVSIVGTRISWSKIGW